MLQPFLNYITLLSYYCRFALVNIKYFYHVWSLISMMNKLFQHFIAIAYLWTIFETICILWRFSLQGTNDLVRYIKSSLYRGFLTFSKAKSKKVVFSLLCWELFHQKPVLATRKNLLICHFTCGLITCKLVWATVKPVIAPWAYLVS